MAYTNLTAAQETALVKALSTNFMGLEQGALLRLADYLVGVAAAEADAVAAVNDTQATSIANLNAWATALATKLNADAGVTDTNYDTNPQA